jgi:hypothetical protein
LLPLVAVLAEEMDKMVDQVDQAVVVIILVKVVQEHLVKEIQVLEE